MAKFRSLAFEEATTMHIGVNGLLKYIVALCLIAGCARSGAMPSKTSPDHTASTASSMRPLVTVVNLGHMDLNDVPVTFGQPFRAGDIPKGDTIVGYVGGRAVPTQADIKARNPDGSVRHAILTLSLPKLGSGVSEPVMLHAEPVGRPAASKSISIRDLLNSDFDARVSFKIHGHEWHLDARDLLQRVAGTRTCTAYGAVCSIWLSGPLVSEWIVGGPIINQAGEPHQHLAAYFAIRAYGPAPIKRVRVDVIVENDWAYTADPHIERYDVAVTIGKQTEYSLDNLDHYRQARWHKVFWWGRPDPVYAQLSSRYLQASLAVPKYQQMQPTEKLLSHVRQFCPPMQRCDQTKEMSTVGAQAAIGPLPRWTSVYVVDPTYRAFRWMLADDDALGAYGVHFRDQKTGQPVSVEAHPCMTLIPAAESDRCPEAPHANDNFPRCTAQCKSPLVAQETHHPAPAYVAYLVTGDWYYLEELKFWADWVVFHQNPAYRGYSEGLIQRTELRGQAWALRTLGYAAYILPDDDPFKGYFNRVVENNIAWYNQQYTDNPDANSLHIIVNGYAVGYPSHGQRQTGTATWQQSFFTWSVGNLADLGFKGARRLRNWVSQFQIRLMTSPHYCWILASAYAVQVRDSRTAPFYSSLGAVYTNTFPQFKGVACNSETMAGMLSSPHGFKYSKDVMTGYPFSPTGFVANFQIGLAAAADSGTPEARQAWEIFSHRKVQPDYADTPQFAVVPRSLRH